MREILICSELSFSSLVLIFDYFDFPNLQDQLVDFHKPEEENLSSTGTQRVLLGYDNYVEQRS